MPPWSRINFRNGKHTCAPVESEIQTCPFPVSFFMPLLLSLITDQKYFSIMALVMPPESFASNLALSGWLSLPIFRHLGAPVTQDASGRTGKMVNCGRSVPSMVEPPTKVTRRLDLVE